MLKRKSSFTKNLRSASYVLANINASPEDFAAVETKINSLREKRL